MLGAVIGSKYLETIEFIKAWAVANGIATLPKEDVTTDFYVSAKFQ